MRFPFALTLNDDKIIFLSLHFSVSCNYEQFYIFMSGGRMEGEKEGVFMPAFLTVFQKFEA